MTTARTQAQLFHSLHRSSSPLALANAWDPASARIVEAAGSPAVATTSAGLAWALGVADGNRLDRVRAIDAIARVVAAVRVPVSADIESGLGATPTEVGETVRQVLATGAVGINIEDAATEPGTALRPAAEQAERIAAARAAADREGVPLFINARTDPYLLNVGEEPSRLVETLDRAAMYLAAGADGIFVPGVTDPVVVAALTEGIDAPVNILVGRDGPSLTDLSKLGVARVSLGSSVAAAAYGVARRAARELLTTGTWTGHGETLDYQELNSLMNAGA